MSIQNHAKTPAFFRIDRHVKIPLYEQIERNLRDVILNGHLQPGEAMPSEWDLAGIYGVSRLTVRRALDDLVRQDWLNRRQGVGTFVSRPTVAAISPSQLSFTQEMLTIGRQPSSRLLSNRLAPASATAAQRLGLAEGEALVELVRLRLADDIPLLHETAYLPAGRFPGLEADPDLISGSLYECLSLKYEATIVRVDQTLKAVMLSRQQAKLLGVEAGSPSIYSECVAYTAEGEAVEYSVSVAHNEYSQFYFSFRRGET